MLELYPSTVRMGKFCLNLVLRAALVALTWAGLLLIGLIFNWVIDYALEVAGAHESVKAFSSAIVLVFVFALMGAAAVTSLFDIVALAKATLKDSSERDRTEEEQGRD